MRETSIISFEVAIDSRLLTLVDHGIPETEMILIWHSLLYEMIQWELLWRMKDINAVPYYNSTHSEILRLGVILCKIHFIFHK